MPLEIACFNTTSALKAITSTPPPSRIELCTNASVGGLTPSLSSFQTLQKHITSSSSSPKIPIPIHIMIRPHARDFIYTPAETQQMVDKISTFKSAGADGFVFGCLSQDSDGRYRVDRETCSRLIAHVSSPSSSSSSSSSLLNDNNTQERDPQEHNKKKKTKITFHRAFDVISASDMASELEVLITLGFDVVLTSGGAKSAVEGVDVLREMVQVARGRIEVLVGGGVRSGNLEMLKRETGAEWFHSSAVVDDRGEEADGEEVARMGLLLG